MFLGGGKGLAKACNVRRMTQTTIAKSFVLCHLVLVFLDSSAVTLSFDGGDVAPVRSGKVSFVEGLSGQAVHLGRDSFLEYSTSIPGFMTPTSGTFMAWFRYDRTFDSCSGYRDRDRAENGDVQWVVHSGHGMRTLFASDLSRSFIGAGVFLIGKIGPMTASSYWSQRVLGGEWHFLAASYDARSGAAMIFADGMMVNSNTFAKVSVPFAKTFTLGSGAGRLGLEGSMDEICFLPTALGEEDFRKEYLKHQPIRYELHDWSVGAGETKAFRFRVRNESAEKVEKTLKFSNGAAVALSLAPNELKEFTVDVKGGKPGLFTLWLNEGEPDARQFECMCLGEKPRTTRNARKTLIGEYDCTKEYPRDYVALCASEVVTNGSLAYLESRDYRTAIPLSAYRFKIRRQGKPHIVELDYPDDKVRNFIFGVYSEKWARLYTKTIDCAGVMTGIDYPLSMKIQTKNLVFWPDSESVSVVVQNYMNAGGWRQPPMAKSKYGEHPAACAAVRIYELDGLPPGPVQGMSDRTRSVAVWDEDPTMDADLTFGKSFDHDRADLEFWRVKWQRTIDYMRWNSMDSWVIKVVNYNGDATAMDATMPEAALPWNSLSYNNGRCRGWAELGADMLCRAGMGFWVRINHRNTNGWFTQLGGGDTKDSKMPDIRDPAVRKAYLRLVAAYRDKFGKFPGFRGITLNEACPIYFKGGEDDTVAFARELAETLRASGGNAEIQIWVRSGHYSRDWTVKFEEWDAERGFGECGVDIRRLSAIPGVRVVPCTTPDFARVRKDNAIDLEYLQDSPSWVRLMRENGVDCINVFRHSNFEIYPSMGYIEAGATPWKSELWLPTFHMMTGEKDFQSYPTPLARPPYTLDSVASLIADCDLQDLLHGWWGLVESGENDEWRRFYGQFRQIPRGRYALAKGLEDPVCVRTGAEGHYLVNREPYPVKMEYIVDGKTETLILRHHEIRFVKGRGANGAVDVKWAKIPTAEKATHLANLERLETAAKADSKNTALVRAAKEARAAFDEGRFHQFRALFHLAEVRRVFHPEAFPKK